MVVRKKISSPQFLSYDHQNFFGITSNDLEGRHVFIFSILYRKKLIFDFLVTLFPPPAPWTPLIIKPPHFRQLPDGTLRPRGV